MTPETFVPKDHPLRSIRKMADEALAGMDKFFDTIYASAGRPSIPPEKLLNAQLLMILYSIRATGNLLSRSTTTSCSAGSWEWLWMRKSGITPASPRTVSDSLVPKLPPSFYPESSNRQRVNDCCCKSISPLMELSSKLGLRSRASSRKIPRMAPCNVPVFAMKMAAFCPAYPQVPFETLPETTRYESAVNLLILL